MTQLVTSVLNAVNLASYSSSLGFLGYFERVGRYANCMAEEAVTCLLDSFSLQVDDWTLISSLHANLDEVGSFGDPQSDAADLDTVDYLCANNVLRGFSYRTRFGTDYESDAYSEAVSKSQLEFIEVPVEELAGEVLQKLLVARMLVYGLRGHLFLVSMKNGLALYPHDDTGFGVIMFGNAPNRSAAIEFLERANHLARFHSVLTD